MSLATKQALADSFRKLLAKRGMDKITVKEIVEDCGVNRQTFYYYFHDIYDLLEWILKDAAENLLARNTDYSDWTEGLKTVMEYIQENRELVLNAYHSISHETLADYIKKCFRPYTSELVRSQATELGRLVTEEDLDFITDIFTLAASGLIMEWIGKHLKREDTVQRLERFRTAINGCARFMLENLGAETTETYNKQKL